MVEDNLELKIDGKNWTVVIEHNPVDRSYWKADTLRCVLYVHNYPLEKAKLACYMQYKKDDWK